MRKRVPMLGLVLGLVLAAGGTAYAYDCIRVSSSPQGLEKSAKSGNWLPFNLGSAAGVQETFANIGFPMSRDDAACVAREYAETGQPKYFALGIGVAGAKNESTERESAGVLAWKNKNYRVLSDGKGIDHIENGVLGALFASLGECGFSVEEE